MYPQKSCSLKKNYHGCCVVTTVFGGVFTLLVTIINNIGETNRTKQKQLYKEKRMEKHQEVEVLVKK